MASVIFSLMALAVLVFPFHVKHRKISMTRHTRHLQKIGIAAEAFFGFHGRAVHELGV